MQLTHLAEAGGSLRADHIKTPAIAYLLILTSPSWTQTTIKTSPEKVCTADPTLPAFEVASISPVAPKDRGFTNIGQYGLPHFTLQGASLSLLLSFTFDVQPANFINAPHGLEDAVFDVKVASADGTPLTYKALQPRMQQLLEQRFCLKAHVSTKQVPGYVLVTAKGGPKVKPDSAPVENGSAYITQHEVNGTSMDMGAFASMLGSPAGRPVQDQTELQGKYTLKVQYASPSDTESALPSIFTALKEQLGLELKNAQVPVKTLVIERVNLTATEN
jgi:uncharacterized protein (TIGR03435 family)